MPEATNDGVVNRYPLPGVSLPVLPDDIVNKLYVDVAIYTNTGVATSDQTVNNTIVPVDSTLGKVIGPNRYYYCNVWIDIVAGTTTAGLRWEFSVPAGSTIKMQSSFKEVNEAVYDGSTAHGETLSTGVNSRLHISGFIKTDVSGAYLVFKFAQQVAEVSDLTIGKGSSMILSELVI